MTILDHSSSQCVQCSLFVGRFLNLWAILMSTIFTFFKVKSKFAIFSCQRSWHFKNMSTDLTYLLKYNFTSLTVALDLCSSGAIHSLQGASVDMAWVQLREYFNSKIFNSNDWKFGMLLSVVLSNCPIIRWRWNYSDSPILICGPP